ncbi:MAG TPA: GAF domain-containing protein [Chloroflexota bacterium]|nr:GAF domain-containing protein [Chloroflexota bacterium]
MDDSHQRDHWHSYYEALYDVAIALGQSLEPAAVLRELVRGVVGALGLRAAAIRLLTVGGLLETVAVEGLSPNYLEKGPVDLAHSPIDREALHGRPVQVADVTVDARFEYPAEARREGIVSAVFVPLFARGEPIGVLRAYTAQRRTFTTGELRLLVALANLGALAIANARLYQVCVRDQQMTAEALWSFHLPNELIGRPEK